MLDQIPTCSRVWAYYEGVFKERRLSALELRKIVIGYLMQLAPLEYLDGEMLECLLLSLHRCGLKVCGGCLHLAPHADFAGLAGRRCSACRRRDRASYQAAWRTENKGRRAKYMRDYRAQKKSPPP